MRKHPTLSSGFYLYDPFCANMIREAIRIGYKVFSYEPNSSETKKNEDGISYREIGQALNIKKLIDKDSNA